MTVIKKAQADGTRGKIQMNLNQLLAAGYLDDNPPDLQRMAISVYRRLGEGRRTTFEEIGEALNISKERVEELFSLIPESAFELDKSGKIVGFIGLSIVPAPHEFNLAEQALYTWCAFDALFLPEILNRKAMLKSTCPASGKLIELTISPKRITSATPQSAVMSIVSPDMKDCCADLRGAFCNDVNLFFNEDLFDSWAENRNDIACFSLDTAMTLAHQRNQARFPDIALS